MNKNIVLIRPHQAMIDCAKLHNIKFIIIDTKNNINNYQAYDLESIFLFDIFDFELTKAILTSIDKLKKIDAIITLTEKALILAAKLSIAMNLPSLKLDAIELINNKYKMRAFLANYEDFAINYLRPKNSDELKLFAEKIGLPIIVKPIDGYGSNDIIKLNSLSEIKKIDFSKNIIAEEFIDGDEFSVEAFSFNGEHKIIAITRKTLIKTDGTSNFTEIGHCVPADINNNLKQNIIKYIIDFLTIIGLDNGPSHTEIKIFNSKINIIETHNRIGGDRISSLVKLSTGIDLVELSILWPLGLIKPITKIITNCHAAIRFFTPPSGKVKSIDGIETLKYNHSIIDIELDCKPGDYIKKITNSYNRYGFVIVTGKNEQDATAKSIEADSAIKFIVDNNSN